jgi:hypothetical protein
MRFAFSKVIRLLFGSLLRLALLLALFSIARQNSSR